jgi:alpha-beta hydrolase superfamily lysophospholipase
MMSFAITCLMFVTSLASRAPQSAQLDAASHAQAVLASLAAKDFAGVEAQFTDRMKAALPAGGLEISWARMLTQAGAFKSCGATRVQSMPDMQVTVTPCEFERAKVDAQVVFDRDGKLAGLLFRPPSARSLPYSAPSYATPASYTEADLTIGAGEWALPATLDIPVGAGPFPALVLVHGSGPNDRDETIGANKPFKDLALGLASRGIAVLRYDKRTKVYPMKLAGKVGLTVKDETVDDAVEAVKTLRAQPRIDPARVFVLGHSLGGMLVPRMAAADPSPAGFIVMAGPARSLEQAILDQTRYLAMADGTITSAEQARIDEVVKLVDTITALTPEDAKDPKPISGAPASYWLDLRGYDAPSAAKAVTRPMLVLQGERDYQVTMDEFGKWKSALAGKPDVSFHSYPALNHLFIAGTGRSLPSEYETAAHVSEDVIRDIADWVIHRR